MIDDVIIALTVIVIAVTIFILSIFVTWGDVTQYDVINPSNQYVDNNGEYHISGILLTKHCGNIYDHVFGLRGYDFIVNRDLFIQSFNVNRMYLSYTCKNGHIENIVWS